MRGSHQNYTVISPRDEQGPISLQPQARVHLTQLRSVANDTTFLLQESPEKLKHYLPVAEVGNFLSLSENTRLIAHSVISIEESSKNTHYVVSVLNHRTSMARSVRITTQSSPVVQCVHQAK